MFIHTTVFFLLVAALFASGAAAKDIHHNNNLRSRKLSMGGSKSKSKARLFGKSKHVQHDVHVHPYNNNNMIYGSSGNANMEFSTVTNKGVEIGLRAKARGLGNLGNFEGCFYFNPDDYVNPPAGFSPPVWNFDFTVNTEAPPQTNIDDYRYEIGIDTDPTENTDFTIKFDPITLDQTTCEAVSVATGGFPPDHALGTGTTTQDVLGRNEVGPGKTYICDAVAPLTPATDCCMDYITLLGEKTVLQQSYTPAVICQLFSISNPGVVTCPDFMVAGGIFDVYWKVLNTKGRTIGKVQIRVYVADNTL